MAAGKRPNTGETMQTITRLTLGRGASGVNAYLLKTSTGFVLVDTGVRKQRTVLLEKLGEHGCEAGALDLVVITHGDFDHIGSAAYLRATFGAPIAMHPGDADMAAGGDMFAGRTRGNRLIRAIASLIFRLPREDRFEPDIMIDEGFDLAGYGLEGSEVLLLRGHSAGSVALLLADGSLISGDVLENRKRPRLGSIMDDVATARASLQRLRTMKIGTVYPGHGRPFEFRELSEGGT